MDVEDTVKRMERLIEKMSLDLRKSVKGNKAASQRVRVATLHFERLSKVFRKVSVQREKKG